MPLRRRNYYQAEFLTFGFSASCSGDSRNEFPRNSELEDAKKKAQATEDDMQEEVSSIAYKYLLWTGRSSNTLNV